MGCAEGKEYKVADQATPAFTIAPDLVSKEKVAYGMVEKVSLKSFFLGADNFSIKRSTTPGKTEDSLKIKQSVWDCGQDRMELQLDVKGHNPTIAVVRRSRMSLQDCFYIYTVEEPYPGAGKNDWNEKLDENSKETMYCFGFLTKSMWGHFQVGVYYADPEKGANKEGKGDPYKIRYHFKYPGWCNSNLCVLPVDEDGKVAEENACAGFVSRGAWQWECANAYSIEVAPGADAALIVICMAMIDEIKEDQQDN
jgi:hypothetical protein